MDVKDLLGKFIKEMADEGMSFILQQPNHSGFFMKAVAGDTLKYSPYGEGFPISLEKFHSLRLSSLRDFQVSSVELPSSGIHRRASGSISAKMGLKESYTIIHVR